MITGVRNTIKSYILAICDRTPRLVKDVELTSMSQEKLAVPREHLRPKKENSSLGVSFK